VDDIFDEAAEDLRTRKWIEIGKKSAPYAIVGAVAALVIALGFWGYSSWQTGVTEKASVSYQAGLDALQAKDTAKAKTLFTETSEKGNDAYKAVSLMQLASLAIEDAKPDDAVKAYDQAAKTSKSPLISDIAALRSVYLRLDANAPYSEIETRLAPLMKDGRPFQPLAKEALALAKVANGDFKGARSDFQALSLTLGTPDALKQRAQGYVLAIDSGTAETAREVAKAKIPDLPANLGAAGGGLMAPQQ
jgi:hypothetical protein